MKIPISHRVFARENRVVDPSPAVEIHGQRPNRPPVTRAKRNGSLFLKFTDKGNSNHEFRAATKF